MTRPGDEFARVFAGMPGRARDAAAWSRSRQGWLARTAALAVVLAIGLIAAVLLVPLLLLAVLIFAALAIVTGVRLRLASWRSGRRPTDDGRENVRVIRRDP